MYIQYDSPIESSSKYSKQDFFYYMYYSLISSTMYSVSI